VLSRVVSNDTRTVSSGWFFSRRGIGASAGSLPEIGSPTEVQRDRTATLPVAWPKTLARDDRRPLEPDRGNIVGAVIVRLIGAVLLEQNDEWQLQHRYMQLEAMAELVAPDPDAEPLRLPPKAA
jgi:hypothetical protein